MSTLSWQTTTATHNETKIIGKVKFGEFTFKAKSRSVLYYNIHEQNHHDDRSFDEELRKYSKKSWFLAFVGR